MKSLSGGALFSALVAFCAGSAAQTWQPLKTQPTFTAGAVLLLTDGSVLVHSEPQNEGRWYKLTPDLHGSYVTGAWSQMASLPTGYTPHFFSSAVLSDGRVLVEGGEFEGPNEVWTNQGAIYDPQLDTWTVVAPPAGWAHIGDAASVVLADGTQLQSDCCDGPQNAALLDEANLTWSPTGAGKFDSYKKEGMTLLPNGKVLVVDAYEGQYDPNGMNSELYDPATGSWSSAGSTIVQLWDSALSCGGKARATYEMGAAVLRPDGTVFATGANICGAGHTAIYDTHLGTWSAGPDFPNGLDMADAPAALEPSGKVLLMASPGFRNPPSTFFEWDGQTLTQVPGPPNSNKDSSFPGHLLELPSGQLLFTDFTTDVEVFTPAGTPNPAWRPVIQSAPKSLARGSAYKISGTQFNGLSQGAMYNDDFQDATNYPIVILVNMSTHHVFFCRTHDHSSMGVATGKTVVSTHFDVPAGMEPGSAQLFVIANGIRSRPVLVTVN